MKSVAKTPPAATTNAQKMPWAPPQKNKKPKPVGQLWAFLAAELPRKETQGQYDALKPRF